MSIKITGTDQIIRSLEKQFGHAKLNKITTQALLKGGEVVQQEMKSAFNEWADTGASRDEIVISVPRRQQGVKRLKLGWNGSKNRWRLIHLNEFGYTKVGRRISPAGIGTIRRTIKATEEVYETAVEQELRRNL
ncbi:gp9 protein [Listeria floridensis FSL S10-1187]|uniref:Gp9 protein n=1 Tax=Listeria floridensis FSL S10-1187 TaxID=1265817 RepID=A0ABP3B328_9LIST|nr:hypothetical protein [Listeria floridensis]EUJ33523.1 gp9 protein [Listeria floridensis FSL S10-1187]